MNREERRRQKKLNKKRGSMGGSGLGGEILKSFKQAQSLFEAGDLEAADDLCQDVSASAPLDAEPFHLRALIQYRMGNLREAGDMILEAITRNDTDPEIHANCGAIMNMLARYPEAEAASRHVLELSPKRADGYSNLAVSLEMQGRYDEAIEACERALQIKPDFPEAQINLGNLRVRSNDLIGAVEAYAKALELAPANPTVHANMSVALLRLEEPDAAEEYARAALAINPTYPEALNALGNALVGLKCFDKAIAAFDRALELRPGSFEAANNRAAAYHKKGDVAQAIDAYRSVIVDGKAPGEIFAGMGVSLLANGETGAAIEAFRKALEAKPGMGEAYYNLASALGAEVDDLDVKQMKAFLGDEKHPLDEKIPLHFALGEVYDKKGEYEQAFASFVAGNTLRAEQMKKSEIIFDPDEFDQEIDQIIATHPAGLRPDRPDNTTSPVFIVGMPRSGTTLVEQILVAHPQISSLGEAGTFMDPGETSPADIAALRKKVAPLFENIEPPHRLIDKTPFQFLSLGAIARIYPQASIIHCTRNPEDVLVSCYFQNFISAHAWSTDIAHIQRFMETEQRLMAHWKQASQLQILDVSYEELVEYPERISRQLVAFLDLPWSDACLQFDKNKGHALTASNWQVRKPVYKSSVGRAKAYRKFMEADLN